MSATTSNGRGATADGTPGPRGNPLLGSMRDFQGDKLGFIQSLTRYGDVALSWAFHLLATHPEAEERLRDELDEVLGTDRRVPIPEDLPRLAYTKMVVDETLRLYPPAWITNRQAVSDDEVLGHSIPAGAFVMLSPYVLQRHPDFWDHPDEFDPARFASGRNGRRPRFAYFPFGGGPRQCIGQVMALVEAQFVLATVLGRCRLRPVSA